MAFTYAIVLTGGIATGKSTVADCLMHLGFCVIDADTIAHKILEEQYQTIIKMFGKDVVKDNHIDRKALGAIVFEDITKKKQLEALLHPLIFDEIERLAKIEDAKQKPYFVDIPLFFETKRYPIDKVLVVYANREEQLKRVMKRDGYTKQEAQKRIDSQIDIEEKKQKATYVIDNSENKEHLQSFCETIKEKILGDIL